mgnify:CR=1 FL=1
MKKMVIKNNILFSSNSEEVNLDYLKNILETTRLDDLIKNNVNGIETYVGEKGTKLSGGQKQRIGIARALYRNAKVIIFDEATSSLDGQSEMDVSDAIKELKGSVTVLMIAHRLSTVRNADKVVYLEGGKVLAIGSFQEVRNQIPEFDTQAQLMGL